MSITTTPPAPAPASNVVPFSLPWGGAPFPPGCCPPGGMSNLMQCWCDIQQAQAFFGAMMIDQINNNPAVTQAIIAAIEKSGSSLPLIGVTNGTDAQPGQVGEWVHFTNSFTMPVGANQQVITLGVLQPGDWDCWGWMGIATLVTEAVFALNPQPAGFTDIITNAIYAATTGVSTWVVSFPVRALTSVPSLLAFTVTTNSTTSAPAELEFAARRRR